MKKTIRPLELQSLCETGQPIEVVDIRPREAFEKIHIEGAHSIPSAQLSVEGLVLSRALLPTEPLYLVSQSGALAQLTACEFARLGLDNLVVVSGGIDDWQRNGLPVVRHQTVSDLISERMERATAFA